MPDPDAELDQLSETPLYLQLADILRARIERGDWEPRDRMDSEAVLSKRYAVSRPTVRQAVKVLNEAGMVRSIPGRGTFVL